MLSGLSSIFSIPMPITCHFDYPCLLAKETMMQERVTFDSQGLLLEGRLFKGDGRKSVIITHPHTLYGGDMDNAVVGALDKVYQEMGWTTFRFNFRGAGQSQGSFDDGHGEQEDVRAAFDFLKARGKDEIALAGYSFGAWVLAHWSKKYNQQENHIYFVSPPVAYMAFPEGPYPGLQGVAAGQLDDLGPPSQIEPLLPQWGTGVVLTIIEKADHFFWDHMGELQQVFRQIIME